MMFPPGAPFDWEEYMRQQNRAGLAAGGVPPEPEPVAPPAPMPPADAASVEPQPVSQAQRTAKEVFGIGSTGPLADRQNQAIDDYGADQQSRFDATGQMEPQQFGKIEGTFLAEKPLRPKEAVEAFMEKNYTPGQQVRKVFVSPQEQLQKNEAYDAKVQQDRLRREQERDRQRERGYANRAATRDKTAMAWEQTLGLNAMQGYGPMARGGGMGGGPLAQNVGGAILLGPGFGEPQYGYGGRGRSSGRSPEQLALDWAELQRRIKKDEETARLGGERVDVAKGNLGIRRDALKASTDAQMWAQKFRQSGLEEDRREAITQGANALTALAADLQRRQAYAKENVGRFFGPEEGDLRDVLFDEKGKPGRASKGEYRKRLDVTRNQLRELKQLDPSNSWAEGLSDETLELIKNALAESPAASATSVP